MVELPDNDILNLYSSLMAEVKARFGAVAYQIELIGGLHEKGKEPDTSGKAITVFGLEFCYLQLRRMSELIALAVLVAHNPLPEFRGKLLETWNAEALMKQLAKLSPIAFPRKATVVPMQELPGAYRILYEADAFLSSAPKSDISRIYIECGDKLHTGHLRSVLKKRTKTYSMEFIVKSMMTYTEMLNQHTITLPDGRVIEAILHLDKPLAHVDCRWLRPGMPGQPDPANTPPPGWPGPPFAA